MKRKFTYVLLKFNEIIDSIRDLDDVISPTQVVVMEMLFSHLKQRFIRLESVLVFTIFTHLVFQQKKKLLQISNVLFVNCLSNNSGLIPDCGLKTRREPETVAALKV